jgi:Flp pilus assembly protein TadG
MIRLHCFATSATAMIRRARERLRDDRGVAAVEFALIFPVMLTLMFGMASLTEQMVATQKIESVAHTLADLAAAKTGGGDEIGQPAITDSDVKDLFKAAELLISPLPASKLKIDIYQVGIFGTTSRTTMYRALVMWKANQNGTNLLSCGVSLTAGDDGDTNKISGDYLANEAGKQRGLILAHVKYDYSSPFGLGPFNWGRSSTISIFRAGYASPRNLFGGNGFIQDKASNVETCNYALE